MSSNAAFKNIFVPAGTTTHWESFNAENSFDLTIGVPVEDNGGYSRDASIVIAVLCDENGDVVEWFTTETPLETIANFATGNMYLVCWDIADRDNENYRPGGVVDSMISAALFERALYSDCFHWSEDVISMPESWLTGVNPKFTNRLPI